MSASAMKMTFCDFSGSLQFLFIYLLPIYFRFDPRVGSYEKSKMFFFFNSIWNYIINGDKIYFVSEINISG
jgi:hypothetical protein